MDVKLTTSNDCAKLTASKDLSIYGLEGNDAIFVDGVNNRLAGDCDFSGCAGGDGNDVLIVKGFNYTLFGGAGNDVLSADGFNNALLVCAPCVRPPHRPRPCFLPQGQAGDDTLSATGDGNVLLVCPASSPLPLSTLVSSAG